MIADADAVARALYATRCASEGWDVVEATNGRDALFRALTHPPSLAVIELDLPLIDGFALCEIIRQDRVTATVPVIALADVADAASEKRAWRAGADAVIVKPTPPDTLIDYARQLLARSRDLRARSAAALTNATAQRKKSDALLARSEQQRQTMMVRAHVRFTTSTPPLSPPTVFCPVCGNPLTYERTHIGGVNAKQPEQWDRFTCSHGCGAFEYRHRTRKVRRVS